VAFPSGIRKALGSKFGEAFRSLDAHRNRLLEVLNEAAEARGAELKLVRLAHLASEAEHFVQVAEVATWIRSQGRRNGSGEVEVRLQEHPVVAIREASFADLLVACLAVHSCLAVAVGIQGDHQPQPEAEATGLGMDLEQGVEANLPVVLERMESQKAEPESEAERSAQLASAAEVRLEPFPEVNLMIREVVVDPYLREQGASPQGFRIGSEEVAIQESAHQGEHHSWGYRPDVDLAKAYVLRSFAVERTASLPH
jgi:hypothetical protein